MTSTANTKKWFEVRFWIREGKNLQDKKLLTNNSPYVEVTLDNEIKRTTCAKDSNNPKWNDKLIFQYNKHEDLPHNYVLKVKSENKLLPNPILGECSGTFENKFKNYQNEAYDVIQDGIISLQNCNQGELNFQLLFKYCNEFQPTLESDLKKERNETESGVQQNTNELSNKLTSEKKLNEKEKKDALPSVQVKAKPSITEKEIEYKKPAEIDQTIMHEKKPQIDRSQEETIEQSIPEKNTGYLDQETLENLRQQRNDEFMNTKPNMQSEKEVVYQQPIEQVKPKVHEHAVLKKNHVQRSEENDERR